jgi:hypothetical protein
LVGIRRSGWHDWDHVRHIEYSGLADWSAPIATLRSCISTAATALIYYFVYFSNAVNVQTLNLVARSQSPSGSFLKFTDRGTWEKQPGDPNLIIWPKVKAAADDATAPDSVTASSVAGAKAAAMQSTVVEEDPPMAP